MAVRYANAEQTIEALAAVGGLTVAQLRREIFGDDWDDLRFPASGINPPGAATDPVRITSLTGYTGAFEFSGSAENLIAGVAQMPHAWKRGTAIRPHIHWTLPVGSANAVDWRLYLRVIGNPDDVAGAWSAAPESDRRVRMIALGRRIATARAALSRPVRP